MFISLELNGAVQMGPLVTQASRTIMPSTIYAFQDLPPIAICRHWNKENFKDKNPFFSFFFLMT